VARERSRDSAAPDSSQTVEKLDYAPPAPTESSSLSGPVSTYGSNAGDDQCPNRFERSPGQWRHLVRWGLYPAIRFAGDGATFRDGNRSRNVGELFTPASACRVHAFLERGRVRARQTVESASVRPRIGCGGNCAAALGSRTLMTIPTACSSSDFAGILLAGIANLVPFDGKLIQRAEKR